MPSKKKKYNARFPAGRIKKIMQSDEEIGKVAQAVPVIISRTLELFVESLLTKTLKITNARNAKTLSPSHMKQCIMAEQRFDFLRELVKNIPDISIADESGSFNEDDGLSSPEEQYPDSDTPYDLSMPSTSTRARQQQQQQLLHQQRSYSGGASSNSNNNNSNSAQLLSAIQRYLHNQNGTGGGGAAGSNVGAGAGSSSSSSSSSTSNNTSHNHFSNRLLQRNASFTVTSGGNSSSGNSNHSNSNNINCHPQHHQSVIRHTATALASDAHNSGDDGQLPTKIARTELTTGKIPAALREHSKIAEQVPKQQLQLLANNNNNNNKNNNSAILTKELQSAVAAIPAPIVNFDFCNKPIVKIDYSNLQMPTTTTLAPQSAPALLGGASCAMTAAGSEAGALKDSSVFNFPTPVINIDLSNIVTTTSATIEAVPSPLPLPAIKFTRTDKDRNGAPPPKSQLKSPAVAVDVAVARAAVKSPPLPAPLRSPTAAATATPAAAAAAATTPTSPSTPTAEHWKQDAAVPARKHHALVKQKAISSNDQLQFQQQYHNSSNKSGYISSSSSSSSNASKSASVSSMMMAPLLSSASKTSINLELDEDYDNI